MRLLEFINVAEAMGELKAEIEAITQTVRRLRDKRALLDVKRAEKRLIAAQMQARYLNLPVKLLGAAQGQCKQQKQPYSLHIAQPRYPSSPQPKKPA
jgi:hypothetical protein